MDEQTNQQPNSPVVENQPPEQKRPTQETPNTPPETKEQKPASSGEKNAGSVAGIVIIVLVLVLGGLYFWGKRLTEEKQALQEGSFEASADLSTPVIDEE